MRFKSRMLAIEVRDDIVNVQRHNKLSGNYRDTKYTIQYPASDQRRPARPVCIGARQSL